MRKIFKRYKVLGVILSINLFLILLNPKLGTESLSLTAENLKDMLLIMPPIFLLIGILDVWVERETMIKFMGQDSGLLGIFIAFLLGSVAAGPLYVSFPFAGVLLKKGSKISNVLIFVGAWASTKIPISVFEASVMGWKFMLTRYIIDIFAIILIATISSKAVSRTEEDIIYENAKIFEL